MMTRFATIAIPTAMMSGSVDMQGSGSSDGSPG